MRPRHTTQTGTITLTDCITKICRTALDFENVMRDARERGLQFVGCADNGDGSYTVTFWKTE